MKNLFTKTNRFFGKLTEHRILFQFVVWDNQCPQLTRVYSEISSGTLPEEFESMFLAPESILSSISRKRSVKISKIIEILEKTPDDLRFQSETFTTWDTTDEFNLLFNEEMCNLLSELADNGFSFFGKIITSISDNDGFANVNFKRYSNLSNSQDLVLKSLGELVTAPSDSDVRRNAADELRGYVIDKLENSRF